jgi:hypothetical protein
VDRYSIVLGKTYKFTEEDVVQIANQTIRQIWGRPYIDPEFMANCRRYGAAIDPEYTRAERAHDELRELSRILPVLHNTGFVFPTGGV